MSNISLESLSWADQKSIIDQVKNRIVLEAFKTGAFEQSFHNQFADVISRNTFFCFKFTYNSNLVKNSFGTYLTFDNEEEIRNYIKNRLRSAIITVYKGLIIEVQLDRCFYMEFFKVLDLFKFLNLITEVLPDKGLSLSISRYSTKCWNGKLESLEEFMK